MTSRRKFLLAGGSLVAGATLAGCSDTILPTNSRARYADWVPAVDESTVRINGQDPSVVARSEGPLGEVQAGQSYGTPVEELQYQVGVSAGEEIDAGYFHVFEGPFNESDLREGITQTSEEFDQTVTIRSDGSYREFDILTVDYETGTADANSQAEDNLRLHIGLGADNLVQSFERASVERGIDTYHGDEPLLFDEADGLSRVADDIGDPDFVNLSREPPSVIIPGKGPLEEEFATTPEVESIGIGMTLEDGAAGEWSFEFVTLYEAESQADSLAGEYSDTFDSAEGFSEVAVETDGRAVSMQALYQPPGFDAVTPHLGPDPS